MNLKNILYKYFPKHYDTYPIYNNVLLNENLNDSDTNTYAKLTNSISTTSNRIPYNNNNNSFKSKGVVKIDNEYILFNGEDVNGLIVIERGYFNSTPENHCNNKILFTSNLLNSIDENQNEIKFKNILPNLDSIPKNGKIKIDNEIISYENYEKYFDSYNFKNCTRGIDSTTPEKHISNSTIIEYDNTVIYEIKSIEYKQNLFNAKLKNDINDNSSNVELKDINGTIANSGEISIDDEFIFYNSYDNVNYILNDIIRGTNATKISDHYTDSSITQYKNSTLPSNGIFKIGNEYFKYWNIDTERFYIEKRSYPVDNSFYIDNNEIISIIEKHNINDTIELIYDQKNKNQKLSELINLFAEYLDISILPNIDKLENANNPDEIDINYLEYLVKDFGENLKDYQYLPFYQSEDQIRNFAKELTTIYKEKGTLSSIAKWNKIISEPIENYQELWSFNYKSFYSLTLLILFLFKYPIERHYYPGEQNFYYPQISEKLYEEISYFYQNKKIYNEYLSGLKLNVKNFDYISKNDDNLNNNQCLTFDDLIVPIKSIDNKDFIYDINEVCLKNKGNTEYYLPFNIEDYNIDLYKSEEELESNPTYIDEQPECNIMQLDLGIQGDKSNDWISNNCYYMTYCDILDKNKHVACDSQIVIEKSTDLETATIELVEDILSTDTTIDVYIKNGKLYNPQDHIKDLYTLKYKPLGFIKIENEIIGYENILYNDVYFDLNNYTGFINKKFTLINCHRGMFNTTPSNYDLNPLGTYLENKEIISLGGNYYRLKLYRNPNNYNIKVNDTINIIQNSGSYNEICTITSIYNDYNICDNIYYYGIDFTTTVAPNTTLLTDIGTKISKKITGNTDRFHLLNYILWRLNNEIEGNDLETSYEMSYDKLNEYNIIDYDTITKSIIFPTTHFKYSLSLNSSFNTDYKSTDIITLILNKIKEYKPKHTVTNLVYSLEINQNAKRLIGNLNFGESYETEIMQGDKTETINLTFPDSSTFSYDLPIIQTDIMPNYGANVDHNYTLNDDLIADPYLIESDSDEREINYGPFNPYPHGNICQLDSFRRRKRNLSFI